jgi:hypothetical protein
MFDKRVYANDRLLLEGSFGMRSCCLAVIRGDDACYISGIQVIIVTHRTAPTWAYLCCCMSNGHPMSIRHLQPRFRINGL